MPGIDGYKDYGSTIQDKARNKTGADASGQTGRNPARCRWRIKNETRCSRHVEAFSRSDRAGRAWRVRVKFFLLKRRVPPLPRYPRHLPAASVPTTTRENTCVAPAMRAQRLRIQRGLAKQSAYSNSLTRPTFPVAFRHKNNEML